MAAARSTPDYHALIAANMVLGGQFVSRINLNLREDKGFTYGARTAFDFRRMPGPFSLQASVQTAATARAIEESLGEIAAIRGPRPVRGEELAPGVAPPFGQLVADRLPGPIHRPIVIGALSGAAAARGGRDRRARSRNRALIALDGKSRDLRPRHDETVLVLCRERGQNTLKSIEFGVETLG